MPFAGSEQGTVAVTESHSLPARGVGAAPTLHSNPSAGLADSRSHSRDNVYCFVYLLSGSSPLLSRRVVTRSSGTALRVDQQSRLYNYQAGTERQTRPRLAGIGMSHGGREREGLDQSGLLGHMTVIPSISHSHKK